MTLKKLSDLRALKPTFREFGKANPGIWDFCVYGSLVRGKSEPGDIDIAIILERPASLENKLVLSQKLRSRLSGISKENFDVRCVGVEDFIDSNFLARAGILGEGFLVLKGKPLSEVLGFKSYAIFTYTLENMTNSEKVKFNYSLNGRRGEIGMMRLKSCERMGSGVLKVPLEHSEEFEEFFEKHRISYKISKTLFY